MTPPLVSIVIPCRNAAPWLGPAIESALAQSWSRKEIIVVDDGSTDDSPAIARGFAARGVLVAAQERRGASAARNHGWGRAQGEFIQFLDADDLLSPEKIAGQMALLQGRAAGTVASCAWGRFASDPAAARFVDQAVFRDFAPLDFLLLAAGSPNAMMHPSAWLSPRAVLEAAGPWDESLSLNDDGEFFCRVLLRSSGIAFSAAGRSYYRSGLPGSLSRRRDQAAVASQFRSLELIGRHLLGREDSPRVRRALAHQWQRFIYDFYPASPALIAAAERTVAALGGSDLSPPMGPRTARLARWLGWRAVWRLKQLAQFSSRRSPRRKLPRRSSRPASGDGSRIAILTARHLCRNPRVWKEATLLGEAGYDVTVIHVSAHPAYEALDQRLSAAAPFRRRKIDHLGGRPAARAGAFSQRLGIWLARKLNRALPLNLAAALGPGPALRREAVRANPDLTIVHTEAAAWAGVQLLHRGRKVAADFEDWYSEDLPPAARRHLPGRKLRAIEGELLRRAAYVTAPSHAMADALQRRYGGPLPVVIANCFPLDPPPAPRRAGRPARLVWFSQTIGAGRGLEEFLAAWKLLPEPPPLTLLGEAVAGYRDGLLLPLPAPLRPRVVFHPWVEPAELPALLATFDVGLALEPREPPNKDLTISNKILQYLNAGLAVLASDTAGQREVLAHGPEAGIVIALAETAATARALAGLVGDPAGLARRQSAARRLAEELYCWEKEAPRLLAAVARALAVEANAPA